MTTAQVVEMSVTVNNNSPIQDDVHPDDQTQRTFEMTPGFKPFTVSTSLTTLFLNFLSRYIKFGFKCLHLMILEKSLSLYRILARIGLVIQGFVDSLISRLESFLRGTREFIN